MDRVKTKQQSPILIETMGMCAMVVLSDGRAERIDNGRSMVIRHKAIAAADVASNIIAEAFPMLAPSPVVFKEIKLKG